MQAISVINNMPETKAEIKNFVQLVSDSVKEGNINPLTLTIKLKAVEEVAKQINKEIKELATTEASKHGKSFDYQNAKVEVAQVGVKYDYSKCQCSEWDELEMEIVRLKEKQKERETFLKTIKGQLTIVNEDTGEMSTIYEPLRTGSESIKITLK